jgi:hypothetical protein
MANAVAGEAIAGEPKISLVPFLFTYYDGLVFMKRERRDMNEAGRERPLGLDCQNAIILAIGWMTALWITLT